MMMHRDVHGLDGMPLAMSYVPWQQFEELYPPCKALSEGTAFPELNLIFCGVRG
ncbi:MAG: spore coat associated protein CotJA [Lachnospiraceae bacterium]|nr:spore coat associated protein CotJA [Lachnospiraceae bacterium]